MRWLLFVVLLPAACSAKPSAPAIDGDGSTTYGGMRLSAPIITDPSAFASFTNPSAYAALSATDKQALVTGHTHTFDDLLMTCAASDPTIVATTESPWQRNANYAAVATCAYKLYGPTPAWVPQLVSDVDICVARLGEAWHTPGTAELAQLPTGYPANLQAALTASGTTEPLYAHLEVFALTTDDTTEVVDLPATPSTITPIAAKTTIDTDPVGVRCVYYD